MKPVRRKRRSNSGTSLIVLIVLLTTVLIGLVACGLPALNKDDPAQLQDTMETAGSTAHTDVTNTTDTTEQEEPSDVTDPPTEPALPDPVTMRVVTDVTAYASPEDSAPTVATLTKGDHVGVVGSENGWSTILLEEQLCYVPSNTLRGVDEYLIVIDAGHQAQGNFEKEPLGPGSTELKTKVASGTRGVSTGMPEYELTLIVSRKLRDVLEARGYQVVMIRDSHDVNISNAERSQMANALYADAFIRVHGNGSEKSSVHGIMTMCQTKNNPYNGDLYKQSKKLSALVLDETVAATGARKQFVWEVDTMTGINWCRVPVTIIEMGYMSNPEEDERMATDEYQQKIAEGIANGIDQYFE